MALKAHQWIYDIEPYKPGEGGKGFIKLASNENPLGSSPLAIKAYEETAASLFKYPDGSVSSLKQALSKKYKIEENKIICGAGSDELIRMIAQAYAGVGDEVISTKHGFLMYRLATKAVGATNVIVAEEDYRADVDLILDAVTKKTKIVYLANPNNPTGTHISREEIERLIKTLPKNVLLVLDCAYCEFVEDENYSDGMEFVLKYDNVIVLRTFSKIYGLAALRLGWGYGSAQIIDVLNRVRGPFNISAPAMNAGIAALKDDEFVLKTKTHNMIWQHETQVALQDLGLKVIPSETNFVLTDLGSVKKADETFEKLKAKKITVRLLKAYDLGRFLRISIGKESEMCTLFDSLKRIV